MYLRLILLAFCVAQVSCFPRHEEEEARVLSEVWEAMDKHRGDDIIVIPRHDGPGSGPSEHHDSSSHHESHDEPPRSGDSEHSEKSESSHESSSEPKSESSDLPPESKSESSESNHGPSRDGEGGFDKMWEKFNRFGDMMNRAVDRLRADDREIRELENGQSSSGLTVFILEIVGAVVVGLILVGLLIFGLAKGVNKLKVWKARRQSERLVDQDAPNMDGTGYQSGYNP